MDKVSLHDIVVPQAASWWPLAPAVWVVVTLVLAVLLVAGVLLWRYQQRRKAKKAALKRLPALANADHHQLTLLLKQACIAYYPRTRIAALSGPQWFQFLLEQLPQKQRQQWQPSVQQWQQQWFSQTASFENYQHFAKVWIQQALPPTKQQEAKHD